MFISYRRSDTAPYAGRLRDALRSRFGPAQVFRDLDHIAPGQRFESVIDSAVSSCDVLVALIGPKWFGARDGKKERSRLHDPQDYVRREIAGALRRDDVVVIPVLVAGAAMPSVAHLPPDLSTLPAHQGIVLTDDGWDDEVARLVEVISPRLSAGGEDGAESDTPVPAWGLGENDSGSTRRTRLLRTGVIAAVVAVVAVVTGMQLLPASGSSTDGAAVHPDPTTTVFTTTTVAADTTTSVAAQGTAGGTPAGHRPPAERPAPPATPGPSPTDPPPPTTTSTSTTTTRPLPPETCKTGYVWRVARSTDLVCVTPATRSQVAADNSVKESRWVDGRYGPHTCITGYVWRDAFDGDDVCVVPSIRDQAAYDNIQAASRRVGS